MMVIFDQFDVFSVLPPPFLARVLGFFLALGGSGSPGAREPPPSQGLPFLSIFFFLPYLR